MEEEMLYLGQTDDFSSQYGWVNLDDLSEEEFEKERQEFFDSYNKDLSYGQEAYEMLNELDRLARELIKKGVPQSRITQAVSLSPDLNELFITRDYRILLPHYGNVEIELDPKTKALYFLFLRHKEGLYRKDLYQLEDELTMIMQAITHTEDLSTPKRNAIDNLISKTKSQSFDDSCAKIKKELLKVMEDNMASYYYIYGEKNQLRGIRLPRYLVKVEKLK